MAENQKSEQAGVSRRTALKAGAAAGVGIAAWTGPQIGRLGAAPAYAAHCTPGQFNNTNYDGSQNKTQVSWPSSCNGGNSGTYGNKGAFMFPNGVTFSSPGGCSSVPATYTLSGVPAGETCQPIIRAYLQASENQSPNPNQIEVAGDPIMGNGSGDMPNLAKSALADPTKTNGSWFYQVRLVCGDSDCFFHLP